MSEFLQAGALMGQRKWVRFADRPSEGADDNAFYVPQGSEVSGDIVAASKRKFENGNVRPTLLLDSGKLGLLEITLSASLFTAVVEAVGRSRFKVGANDTFAALGQQITIRFVKKEDVDGWPQYTWAVKTIDPAKAPF